MNEYRIHTEVASALPKYDYSPLSILVTSDCQFHIALQIKKHLKTMIIRVL